MNDINSKIFLYLVILFSVVVHEYSHSFVANELGDDTAKRAGRLTLNPLAHIDILGTIIVPLFLMFTAGAFMGWAKPVPFNPYNIRDPQGELKIALGGPAANLCLALLMSMLFLAVRFLMPEIASNDVLVASVGIIIYVNIFIALFNLIPIPPLDGSKILSSLFPHQSREIFSSIGPFGIILALFISILFLSPIASLIFALFTGFGYVLG